MEHILEWLNENETRAYPLLDEQNNKTYLVSEAPWKFPDNLILDLQLIVKDFSLYENNQHNVVYLKNITLDEEGVIFTFGGNSPGQEITSFTIDAIEGNFPVYLRNQDGSLIVLGEGLLDFIAACKGEYASVDVNIPVEPGTCVEYREDWEGVTGIITSPEKKSNLENSELPVLPLEPIETVSKLTGDIAFLEGYNFNVAIRNSLIDLIVGTGYGLTMDCSTHFILPEFLDCANIVSYVNGISPDEDGNVRILEGTNVLITQGKSIDSFSDNFSESANLNTLFVSLSFQKTDLCFPITPSIL
jgi:hypothetical protein